jgi:hypothetical protein
MFAGGLGAAAMGIVANDQEVSNFGAVLASGSTVVVAVRKDEQSLQAPLLGGESASLRPQESALKSQIDEIQGLPLDDERKRDLSYLVAKQHYRVTL